MKTKHSVTIRMGAAHWDATINDSRAAAAGHPPVVFNFRRLTTPQRKQWYGAFMSSVRRLYRGGGKAKSR